jgi:hypothetical protein
MREVRDLMAKSVHPGLEEVGRLGVRLLIQSAVESEITEFLGRERYAHGERARPGSRNGNWREGELIAAVAAEQGLEARTHRELPPPGAGAAVAR